MPKTPAVAAAEETADADLVVKYNDDTYTIPRSRLSSLEFLEAAQDGKDVLMVRALLGPVQWAQFKAKNTDREHTLAFAEAFGEALGTPN